MSPADEGCDCLPGSSCSRFLHQSHSGAAVVSRVQMRHWRRGVGRSQASCPHICPHKHTDATTLPEWACGAAARTPNPRLNTTRLHESNLIQISALEKVQESQKIKNKNKNGRVEQQERMEASRSRPSAANSCFDVGLKLQSSSFSLKEEAFPGLIINPLRGNVSVFHT